MSFTVINPATGREVNRYDATSEAEIKAAIEKADAASRDWRRRDFADRARLMKAADAHELYAAIRDEDARY